MLVLVFAISAALSWRKWPDLFIDFGTQLYIPWRILHGAVLYRDLFYFAGGPFSQYFNALLFKIFGVSFSTLIGANLILTALMILIIYRYFLAATDVGTATMIGASVIIVFAFSEFGVAGNFNYIAPYSHDVLHGLVLSVMAIALLHEWIRRGKIIIVTGVGFSAGIIFLTKPDIFMALMSAVFGAFVLFCLRHGKRNFAKSLAFFALAGIIPSLFFFLLFLREEGWRESLRSVVFGWLPLFQGTVTKNWFYLSGMGLDQPATNLCTIIIYFIAVFLVVVFYTFVLRWLRKVKWKWHEWLTILLVLVSPLLAWAFYFDWLQCGWPLPLLCLSTCILIIWSYKTLESPPVFPLLWSLFALALLAKLGLHPRIFQYGFALAMPAFVTSIYLLLWLLPKLSEIKWGISPLQFRLVTGLVLLIGFGNLFNQSLWFYEKKTQAVGAGGDEVVTYGLSHVNTQIISAALQWTQKNVPHDATMAVVPEGVMLNYLTRRVNPTPCLFWDPNVMTIFGQARMTAVFEKNPPDYIFIIARNFSDFGLGSFGSSPDFGLDLMQWIQANYQVQILFGNEPLNGGLFGIEILKHAAPGTRVSSAVPPPLGQ